MELHKSGIPLTAKNVVASQHLFFPCGLLCWPWELTFRGLVSNPFPLPGASSGSRERVEVVLDCAASSGQLLEGNIASWLLNMAVVEVVLRCRAGVIGGSFDA